MEATFINCSGKLLDLSEPVVMGILNITPDSFYDGGNYMTEKNLTEQAGKMLEEGAAIIDIGAVSTRPGSDFPDDEEEKQRLLPAVSSVRKNFPNVIISVDTFRSEIARMAIDSGADIINDISAGSFDSRMFATIAELKVPYIIMHIKGTPKNMQENPEYENVVLEVTAYFSEKINRLRMLGVRDIIIDPGFGFGKNLRHNYDLLAKLDYFKIFELPILAGLSRKSLINRLLNIKAAEALNGTTVLNTIALEKGAAILRVHDVKQAVEAVKIVEFIKNV